MPPKEKENSDQLQISYLVKAASHAVFQSPSPRSMEKGPITKLKGARNDDMLPHQISRRSFMAPLSVKYSIVQKIAGRPQTMKELFFIHFHP